MQYMRQLPAPTEYIALRDRMGWGRVSVGMVEKTLAATTLCVCAREGQELVGLVRFLGDGCLYFFLADLVVRPDYAGRGLASELMRAAMEHVDTAADRGASVTVVPLAGLEGLYAKFGFEPSPCGPFGHGMVHRRHMTEPDGPEERQSG